MGEIIDLNDKRIEKDPTYYTVHFSHDKNGFSFTVEGLANEAESNKRLACYLRDAAEILESKAKGGE